MLSCRQLKIPEKKVIRFVNIKKETDPENPFRELLLHFYPWRKEQDIKGDHSSYQEKYCQCTEQISMKQAMFSSVAKSELHAAFSEYQLSTCALCGHEPWVKAYSAPNMEHFNEQDLAEDIQYSSNFSSLLPSELSHSRYDLGQDIRVSLNSHNTELWVPLCIPDAQYYPLVQSLNVKQKCIFHHVLHAFKMKEIPLHLFITGGAGVGKSQLLKAIHQSLLRIFSPGLQENPDDLKVLLTAPTGKAVYLIRGSTIHSALQIPVSQGFHYKPLSAEKLNTLRTKYKSLKLMIIDEVSMVGNGMLSYINIRFQDMS